MILLYRSYFDFWTDPRESGSWRPSRSNDRGLEDLQQTKVRSRIHFWTILFDILDHWNSGLPSCSSSRTLPTTSVTRSKNDLRVDLFLLSSLHQVPRVRSSKAVSRGLRHQEDSDSDGQRSQARRGRWSFQGFGFRICPAGEKAVGGWDWGGSGVHALRLSSRPVSDSEVVSPTTRWSRSFVFGPLYWPASNSEVAIDPAHQCKYQLTSNFPFSGNGTPGWWWRGRWPSSLRVSTTTWLAQRRWESNYIFWICDHIEDGAIFLSGPTRVGKTRPAWEIPWRQAKGKIVHKDWKSFMTFFFSW